ncbi:MAG TPA: response regulator [Thermoanaerobaculia bacterium]|nr:response regulator [Thermoanaerobaculia bacterium]
MRREAPRVLIVDDSPSVLFMLSRALEQMDFRVDTADSARAALAVLARREYRAIITDLHLGGDERTLGLEVLSACRRLRPKCPVIVLTGFGNPTVMEKALRLGATFYFEKPVSLERLRLALAGEARP